MKRFLKLVKLESIRIARNKFIMFMLLAFSVGILLMVYLTQTNQSNYPVAVYIDEFNENNVQLVDDIFENFDETNFVKVDNLEHGKNLMKKGKACLFIYFDSTTQPITAKIYYDNASLMGRSVKGNLEDTKNQYAYKAITDFLSEYGFVMNDSYFNQISFHELSNEKLSLVQSTFVIIVASCLAIILMFGLTYSIARDNETNVSRNLSYMPLNVHAYLFSKIIPYLILGIFESVIIYLMGYTLFKIPIHVNFLIIILVTILFIISTILLGILFSFLKNQISTVFLCTATILLPLFALILSFIQSFPIPLQIVFYALPFTTFVQLGNALVFNGAMLWDMFTFLVLQIVIYYIIAVLLTKRKSKQFGN